ncbi:hypothetical protein OX284_014575 [Flavobacterium sp. SUN046]|uniref:hypothetical protein n=1 Tax=Flavobacterium sp. SUN046 TaxID=3002440 RepID=UPI002DBA522B|nr:hypothetical protein [Flavobacterium sp. SUN046]MEC4050661.1 hypothetical protein [Flavobacterium sp. SUN046]
MSNLKNILNGWSNYLIGSDQTTNEEAKRRASICSECPIATDGIHTAILPDFSIKEIQGMYCSSEKGGCGCPLSPAVRSKNHNCPKNKW